MVELGELLQLVLPLLVRPLLVLLLLVLLLLVLPLPELLLLELLLQVLPLLEALEHSGQTPCLMKASGLKVLCLRPGLSLIGEACYSFLLH